MNNAAVRTPQSAFGSPNSKIIKVLLVDDSLVALTIYKRMLSSSPDIKVVGTARNGKEALELIPHLDPTVICTDLHMPVMDGLELTKEIMDKHPRPILVLSVSVQEGKTKNIFRLLDAGAVDVFPKPRSGLEAEYQQQAEELISKLRVLSGVRVFRRYRREPEPLRPPVKMKSFPEKRNHLQVVAIGASTGGPQALQHILMQLPRNFPLPVICVQHIGEGFLEGLVEWLQSVCAMNVEIARKGAQPMPGTVYFPQEGAHLIIDEGGRFEYSIESPFNGHRPSITVTFRSIADYYGQASIGVLLTGMGSDGAEGMQSIKSAGGITIVQDEETSVVFGMPKRAIELNAAQYIIPLNKIAGTIVEKLSGDNSGHEDTK